MSKPKEHTDCADCVNACNAIAPHGTHADRAVNHPPCSVCAHARGVTGRPENVDVYKYTK